MNMIESNAMETIEAPTAISASFDQQTPWLEGCISGVNDKMKAILNILEEDDSAIQSSEIHERRKEGITRIVEDICTSYCSLAQDYDNLKSASAKALNSDALFSPPNEGRPQNSITEPKDSPESWDDSQFGIIDSNPESTVEDADIAFQGITNDLDGLRATAYYLVSEDENTVPQDVRNVKRENIRLNGMKYKFTKLVEENTKLQVELIRRNSEKRNTIRKLQDQVNSLMSENYALQRHLKFYERNKEITDVNSPSRKKVVLDRFFRCTSFDK